MRFTLGGAFDFLRIWVCLVCVFYSWFPGGWWLFCFAWWSGMVVGWYFSLCVWWRVFLFRYVTWFWVWLVVYVGLDVAFMFVNLIVICCLGCWFDLVWRFVVSVLRVFGFKLVLLILDYWCGIVLIAVVGWWFSWFFALR